MFDFSSYPKDPKFFDDTNKRVIRKTKDESEWKIIDEFVGLKSKMFSIGGKESNTAKGVNIATEFSEFKDTLLNKKVLKWEEFKAKNIKWEHTKSTKYYLFLMIKDLF